MSERGSRGVGAPVLQLQGVNVFYGRSHAVQGVDLALHSGVVSVVGRNGMGKTTMCKAIMGLVPVPPAPSASWARNWWAQPGRNRADGHRLRAAGQAALALADGR